MLAHEFECRKRSMTLVEMKDCRIDTQLSQQTDAAHAEHFFLDDPRLDVAAV